MFRSTIIALVCAILFLSFPVSGADKKVNRTVIGFGSCSHQSRSQAFWDPILANKPDYFIFGGDNIYSDTYNMELQWKKYQQMAALPGFQKLKKSAVLFATWDDHDYGLNDSGEEFREKVASRENFFRFWNLPKNSPRRKNPGICDAKIVTLDGKRIQFIILDTRYFRSELIKREIRGEGEGRYTQNTRKDATILGTAQWTWLEKQLMEPADIRLIVSSIQVIPEEHNWEAWKRFPEEHKKLYRLIKSTKADGVVFLTGDRHMAEISRNDKAVGYPLYDITSSGLNMGRGGYWPEPNKYRLGNQFFENNFGLVTIEWFKEPVITMEIRDDKNNVVLHEHIKLSTLKHKR